MRINVKAVKSAAICLAFLLLSIFAWFFLDAIKHGQEVRQAQASRDELARIDRQKASDAEDARLQPLIDELGVIGAADAHSKGMTAADYKRAKEAVVLQEAKERIEANSRNNP